MKKLICLSLLWATAAGRPAFAKPRGDCEALLKLTRQTLEDFAIHPLTAYPSVFVIVSAADIGSLAGENIRARIGLKVSTITVATPREFRDKRVLTEFENKDFAVIDTLESFVRDEDFGISLAYVEQLRASLRKRMAAKRPTLILVTDPASINRYLARLDAP